MGKDKANHHAQQDRNGAILNMLRMKRSMKIAELQEKLGVSDMTVRRCLNEMAAEGLIKRVHGGATIIDPWEREMAFHNRVADNLEIKMALASRIQPFIPEGGSIYLDGGTTCFEIAKRLSIDGKKCTVVTDSIAIVRELLGKNAIESVLLGGRLTNDGNTLDGPVAVDAASRMSVDLCILSCDSFNDGELQTQSLNGLQAKRVMIQRASLSMCVSASNKYGKNRCFHLCDWSEIDMLLTDAGLPDSAAVAIGGRGVEIHVVDVGGEDDAREAEGDGSTAV